MLRRREADEAARGGQGPRGEQNADPRAPVRIPKGGTKLKCGKCGVIGHNIRRCGKVAKEGMFFKRTCDFY